MDDGRHAGIPAVPDVIGIGTSVATDAGTGVSPPPAPPPGDFSRPVPSHGESHTEKHADVADSTTPAVEPISRLMGVRPDDGMRGQSAKRDVPRLRFRPFHAVTVMLVLTTALCASLTMLLQQSLRYVSAQSHNAAMQNAGGKETGIAETLPGGSDGSGKFCPSFLFFCIGHIQPDGGNVHGFIEAFFFGLFNQGLGGRDTFIG